AHCGIAVRPSHVRESCIPYEVGAAGKIEYLCPAFTACRLSGCFRCCVRPECMPLRPPRRVLLQLFPVGNAPRAAPGNDAVVRRSASGPCSRRGRRMQLQSEMEKFNRSGYYRRVLQLAFPVILSQAGQILVQLVDNAMVGRLGAVPLAGVSFANSVFFMLFVLGTGMSLGLTPLVGEMYSVSNHRKSAAFLQNSILFYGCMGVCIFLLAMVVRSFMGRMGHSPEVVEQAVPYFSYVAVSVIPFMIFAAFKQFLEGIGNTRVAMAII